MGLVICIYKHINPNINTEVQNIWIIKAMLFLKLQRNIVAMIIVTRNKVAKGRAFLILN